MSLIDKHPAAAPHLAAAAHSHRDAAQATSLGKHDDAKACATMAHEHSEAAQKQTVAAHTASHK